MKTQFVSNYNKQKLEIDSIVETEICSYEMKICSEFLCPEGNHVEEAVVVPEKSLTSFFRLINETCIYRQEDWWTYELCFNKGLRQYHAHLIHRKASDGTPLAPQKVG